MAEISEITKGINGMYGFHVVPSGDYIDIQLVREENANVYIATNIGGLAMAPKFINNPYLRSASTLFRVTETKGKVVFVQSESRIKSCKVMDEDGTVTDVALDDDLRLLSEDGGELLTENGYSLCLEKE